MDQNQFTESGNSPPRRRENNPPLFAPTLTSVASATSLPLSFAESQPRILFAIPGVSASLLKELPLVETFEKKAPCTCSSVHCNRYHGLPRSHGVPPIRKSWVVASFQPKEGLSEPILGDEDDDIIPSAVGPHRMLYGREKYYKSNGNKFVRPVWNLLRFRKQVARSAADYHRDARTDKLLDFLTTTRSLKSLTVEKLFDDFDLGPIDFWMVFWSKKFIASQRRAYKKAQRELRAARLKEEQEKQELELAERNREILLQYSSGEKDVHRAPCWAAEAKPTGFGPARLQLKSYTGVVLKDGPLCNRKGNIQSLFPTHDYIRHLVLKCGYHKSAAAATITAAHKFWLRSCDTHSGNEHTGGSSPMPQAHHPYVPAAPLKRSFVGGGQTRAQITEALNRHPNWDPRYHDAVYAVMCHGQKGKDEALIRGLNYATLRNYCSQIRGEIKRKSK